MIIHTKKSPGEFPDKITTHVPMIMLSENKITVTVGESPHPMKEEHLITLIELFRNGKIVARRKMNAGDLPEAMFKSKHFGDLKARATCNIHGVWES